MWTNKFVVVSLFRVRESLFVGRLAWRDGVPSDYGAIAKGGRQSMRYGHDRNSTMVSYLLASCFIQRLFSLDLLRKGMLYRI